jgi:hypothetical protein
MWMHAKHDAGPLRRVALRAHIDMPAKPDALPAKHRFAGEAGRGLSPIQREWIRLQCSEEVRVTHP